jgi:excisionase family DNA binding protein
LLPCETTAELPALLTPAEVCAALRISRATLYRMVARQDIEVVRLGRGSGATLRVPARELERLLGTASVSARSTPGRDGRERPRAAGSSDSTNPKEAP